MTPWAAHVLTLYPEMFPGPLGVSLAGKALGEGRWSLETVNIRTFSDNRYQSVDDTPAGGGAGMVMRADILAAALDSVPRQGRRVIYPTPRGVPLTQSLVRALAEEPGVILLCGRFEGVDQRLIEARGLDEVSLGDFVLSGGEIAALALLDATVRLLPGVLGAPESLAEESFENGLLEYPQYTRPIEFEGLTIPDVLMSGHHARIKAWRHAQSVQLTQHRRPDLWDAYQTRLAVRPPQTH
ncbi:MAG TPA: tRNA (guanosine(37)-N1)-methyltransferase TrmD [Alphaproteobacteria bacterium]|nr:tRNA (guanosine(37)-N1)-methyltransferase TrmD [Alphaproteobacteria bacterium]